MKMKVCHRWLSQLKISFRNNLECLELLCMVRIELVNQELFAQERGLLYALWKMKQKEKSSLRIAGSILKEQNALFVKIKLLCSKKHVAKLMRIETKVVRSHLKTKSKFMMRRTLPTNRDT